MLKLLYLRMTGMLLFIYSDQCKIIIRYAVFIAKFTVAPL